MSYLASPNDPHPELPRTPDLVSDALGRRTLRAFVTVGLGLGVAELCLRVAGERGNPTWLLLIVFGTALVALLMRFFEWGLIGFIGVAWLAVGTPEVAQGGSGGGQRLLVSQVGLLLLLSLWVVQRIVGQRFTLIKAPLVVPIALYLFVCQLSTAVGMLFPNLAVLQNSPKQYFQVNIIENLMRLLALGGLIMVANVLHGKSLRAGMVMMVLPGLLTFTGLLPLPVNSYMAFAQIIAMAILAAYAVGDDTPTWRRLLFGAIALSIFGFYFIKGAQWVSGWFGGLVALAVVTFWGRRPLFLAGLAAAGLVVIANFGYFYKNVYVDNFYGSGPTSDYRRKGQTGTFTNDRSRMLLASFRYASEFPLGVGLGNYRSYNSYFGRVDVWNTTTFTSAHGSYAQALSETGWPGLICLLLLLYASGRTLRGYFKALPPGPDRNYVLGAWGGTTGVFAASFNGDYLFPAYHNGGVASFGACLYTWLVIGVCVALAKERGLTNAASIGAREVAPFPSVAPLWSRFAVPLRSEPYNDLPWMDRAPRFDTPPPPAQTPEPIPPTPTKAPQTDAPPAPVFSRPVQIERTIFGTGHARASEDN